jgi:hypothetical protein
VENLATILQAARYVTTLLSLLAGLAATFAWLVSARKERSLRAQIADVGVAQPEVVLKILKQFKDDRHRLMALKGLLNYDAALAKKVIEKAKDNIDVSLNAVHTRNTFAVISGLAALLFIALAIIGWRSSGTSVVASPLRTLPGQSGSATETGSPTDAKKLNKAKSCVEVPGCLEFSSNCKCTLCELDFNFSRVHAGGTLLQDDAKRCNKMKKGKLNATAQVSVSATEPQNGEKKVLLDWSFGVDNSPAQDEGNPYVDFGAMKELSIERAQFTGGDVALTADLLKCSIDRVPANQTSCTGRGKIVVEIK